MKSEPIVSVIIPTYNRSALLSEAVGSVLVQTHQDFEVVVVDDGSTDDTRDMVARCGPPVRYVYQDNQGRSAARNRGIREARGEFLLFLDSDDLLLPGSLGALACCLLAHPEVGVAYSESVYCDSIGQSAGLVKLDAPPSACFLDQLALANVVGSIHSALVRRNWLDLVDQPPFDESLVICEDQDLWLRLAALGCEFHHLGQVTCKYRLHGGNTLGIGVPNDPRRRELHARARLKVLNSGVFARLSPEAQITFLYTLLLDPLHGQTSMRESVLVSPRFRALPSPVQSKLLYLTAIDHLSRELDPEIACSWLKRAVALSPRAFRYRVSSAIADIDGRTLVALVGGIRQARQAARIRRRQTRRAADRRSDQPDYPSVY